MGYQHLFHERDLALLYDWLQETGELYVDLDRPHSGGDNSSTYFIDSLAQLKKIVGAEGHREISITIFRQKQYPIRGVVDESLVSEAIAYLRDGEWFSIVSLGDGPLAPCKIVASGDTQAELRQSFDELKGHTVRFGQNPFDLRNSYFGEPENAWVAQSYMHPPKIVKNWQSYPPYETNPDHYRQIALW